MTQLPPSPQRGALQGAYAQAQGGAAGPPGAPPPGGPGAGAPGDVPDPQMQQVISHIAGKVGALEDIVKQLVQKVGGVEVPPQGAPPGAPPGGPPGAPPAPAPRGPAGAPPNAPPR